MMLNMLHGNRYLISRLYIGLNTANNLIISLPNLI